MNYCRQFALSRRFVDIISYRNDAMWCVRRSVKKICAKAVLIIIILMRTIYCDIISRVHWAFSTHTIYCVYARMPLFGGLQVTMNETARTHTFTLTSKVIVVAHGAIDFFLMCTHYVTHHHNKLKPNDRKKDKSSPQCVDSISLCSSQHEIRWKLKIISLLSSSIVVTFAESWI